LLALAISKESVALHPLNDLLLRIDQKIQREDPVIHRFLQQQQGDENQQRGSNITGENETAPLPFHGISTHDNLKESLYRTSKMKFRPKEGFVGSVREIYKYKTQPQKVKTPVSCHLSSRNSLDSEEYSM
jgi:hypothetical protein